MLLSGSWAKVKSPFWSWRMETSLFSLMDSNPSSCSWMVETLFWVEHPWLEKLLFYSWLVEIRHGSDQETYLVCFAKEETDLFYCSLKEGMLAYRNVFHNFGDVRQQNHLLRLQILFLEFLF